jgi:hypothetical protein
MIAQKQIKTTLWAKLWDSQKTQLDSFLSIDLSFMFGKLDDQGINLTENIKDQLK